MKAIIDAQRFFRFIYLFIFTILSAAAAQTTYIPTGHWIYDYLNRLETRRVIPVALNSTQPMTRHELALLLEKIDTSRLNNTEQQQLDYLRLEFQEEWSIDENEALPSRWSSITRHPWIDPWLPDVIYANQRNFLSYKTGPLKVFWDPIFLRGRMWAAADSLDHTEKVFYDTNGFRLRGTIWNVGFYTDIRDTREWGTRRYGHGNTTLPGFGFAQASGDQVYHDETIAYLVYQWKNLVLQFGKDSNSWGPGHFGHMLLSQRATSYDQFKLQLSFPRFKFTSMIGWLKHYNPFYYRGASIDKMITAHRLECAPWTWLQFGIHETVIFSGRTFEPAYLNPVMFYRSAEHYLGDQDNAAMGLDAELFLLPQTKIYGELFIDDMQTQKIFTDYYGNKIGWLAGLYHVDVFSLPNIDAVIEYARIRPYVYSHKFYTTSYTHFGTGLGHWIGPNADVLTAQLQYRPSHRFFAHATTQWYRHAESENNINTGGNIHDPHKGTDPLNVAFLQGQKIKQWSFNVGVDYKIIYHIYMHASLRFHQTQVEPFENSSTQFRREGRIGISINDF